jgi:hypothetical protein
MEPNEEVLYRILHTNSRCFLPSLAPFGQAVSEEKIFLTLANQKQELPLVAIFVGGGPFLMILCSLYNSLSEDYASKFLFDSLPFLNSI